MDSKLCAGVATLALFDGEGTAFPSESNPVGFLFLSNATIAVMLCAVLYCIALCSAIRIPSHITSGSYQSTHFRPSAVLSLLTVSCMNFSFHFISGFGSNFFSLNESTTHG